MWELVLSSHHVGLRDGTQVTLWLNGFRRELSCTAFIQTGHRTRLASSSLCSWVHPPWFLSSSGWYPLSQEGEQGGVPLDQHPQGSRNELWGVGAQPHGMGIFIYSIRMACTDCTRMYITSTLSTRYRAYRCCSARPECAQVSDGRGAAQVCGPSPSQSWRSESLTCFSARPACTQEGCGHEDRMQVQGHFVILPSLLKR